MVSVALFGPSALSHADSHLAFFFLFFFLLKVKTYEQDNADGTHVYD